MPKLVVARLIYEGQFEWVVRMTVKDGGDRGYGYRRWMLPKKDYTLDGAKDFRNAKLLELEKSGERTLQKNGIHSTTVGRN